MSDFTEMRKEVESEGTMMDEVDVDKLIQMLKEINISKYSQTEFREVVDLIYTAVKIETKRKGEITLD